MKEVEKNEIKRLSDRLDAIRHQQADLSLVEAADKYAELEKEKATLEAEIARLRDVHSQKLSKEAQKLMNLPYRRAISKKEQADMGKLKKSVRGLVVVHPMTALGREMGLQEMTGFAKTEFLFFIPGSTSAVRPSLNWPYQSPSVTTTGSQFINLSLHCRCQ